jgi:hypothetical protein
MINRKPTLKWEIQMNNINKTKIRLTLLAIVFIFIVGSFQSARSQELRWLRVGQLQNFIVDYGSENELTPVNNNSFMWPAQYGDNQHTSRQKGLWIGATNFYDPVQKIVKNVKVVGSGPRYDANNQAAMIFSRKIKLIGRSTPPVVVVDGQLAARNSQYDVLDTIDQNIPCDRMVLITFNTSMGVSVTKKVMAFTQQNHDDYFIYDFVFTNTGIYNAAGDVYTQTLNNFTAHFQYRYAFAGVTSSGFGSNWGAFSSEWGSSTVQHDFGIYRSPAVTSIPGFYTYNTLSMPDSLRGFYAYYAPSNERSGILYDQDWGCPNQNGGGPGLDGVLGSAKYAGCVTLFASQSPSNYSVDDPLQPTTTSYFGPDEDITQNVVSQYNDAYMADRWSRMTDGHLPQSMEEQVGTQYAGTWNGAQTRPGGAQGQGYGPYTLAPGESIHIVFAEGVNGLSWEACRSVGSVWYQYFRNGSGPALTMPDGSTAASYTDYTRGWVQTGRDSIIQTFKNAIANYRSGYSIAQPPDPPSRFTVTSGGDKIQLTWTPPTNTANLAGYVIYRSVGAVKDYLTFYTKVFETNNPGATGWDDTSAARGFHYYYYIQSKDDGLRNDVQPGVPLCSSLFYMLPSTDKYALLLRPAGNLLGEIRVVPNPYDIRARKYQFADPTGLKGGIDEIKFYGLPPECELKIFTEDGTLIREINHTNGAGDEAWDSKTSSGQIVVSGIYILYVQVNKDIYATENKTAPYDIYDENLKLLYTTGASMFQAGEKIFSAGQTAIRKFVVIR